MLDMRLEVLWLFPVLTMVAGLVVGFLACAAFRRAQRGGAGREAERIVGEARAEAEALRRDAELDARALQLRVREAFEAETAARRAEQVERDALLSKRESALDRRLAVLDRKETAAEARQAALDAAAAEVQQGRGELDAARAEVRDRLARVAGLTVDAARGELLAALEQELRGEAADLVRRCQDEALATAADRAREVLVTAIERFAAPQVAETAAATVRLPSDGMKGRIIGREGRNIRALEAETGCTIVIDDTPGVALVSGFDPIRREIARRALERLVADGRIHPPRIEEAVAEVRAGVEQMVREAGAEAVRTLDLEGVAPEVEAAVGQLRFRHSFGQNVLQHAIEAARLMGAMASEIGLDPALARRVGLFHDLGKAMDHESEGSHAAIGADFLRRHGESAEVVDAVAAHHREASSGSAYAALAAAADAVTAARPGARSENAALYVERLARIEAVAAACPGVRSCYAVQAGRELRVLAAPEKVDDAGLVLLAREIGRRLSEEVRFSGQIRVTVIRETRCVEYAR